MMGRVSRLLLATTMSALAGVAYADEPSAIGYWVTADHGAVVNVMPCDGGGLCGRLVGLRTDHKPGDVPRDIHNPDKAKQNTPSCGLLMMGNLKPVKGSATKWEGGWVYDPESGSTYRAEMRLDGPDRLKLRGYLGISLFGQTQDWTRETGENNNRCTPPAGG